MKKALAHFAMRRRWYTSRKKLGHPISMWRALFTELPMFGMFCEGEKGCPDWARREYLIVSKNID